jgi:ATP-dependent Zn protease
MKRLYKRHTIDIATIEPRGPVGGFVAPVPLEEEGFPWRSTQEDEVVTYLASLAGERHFYGGDNSAGVGGDMRGSTTIVMSSLGFAAMGKTLVSHSVFNVVEGDRWKTSFGDAVEEKMQELFKRAQALICENERWVMAISHALERYHTITGEDIDAILDGSQGPVVDGAWYHTDDFVEKYRAFHARALDAHAAQSPFKELPPMPEMAMAIAAASHELTPDGAVDATSPSV